VSLPLKILFVVEWALKYIPAAIAILIAKVALKKEPASPLTPSVPNNFIVIPSFKVSYFSANSLIIAIYLVFNLILIIFKLELRTKKLMRRTHAWQITSHQLREFARLSFVQNVIVSIELVLRTS
jgi:hypothetical protein